LDYKKELEKRIANRQKHSLIDVNTRLAHFALISYAGPLERISQQLPKHYSFDKNLGNGALAPS